MTQLNSVRRELAICEAELIKRETDAARRDLWLLCLPVGRPLDPDEIDHFHSLHAREQS